jgi:type I restriction enzyme S subunit
MTNRYSKYKPSGVEWIGEIPEHWGSIRLKHEYKIQKGKIPSDIQEDLLEGYVPYLSMEYLRDKGEPKFVKKDDGILVNEEDLLILWDGSNSGEIVVSKMGILSSTMGVLNQVGKYLNKKFSFYLLKSFEPEIRNNTNGMGIPHVDGDFVRNLRLFNPPLPEQEQIVKYLDEKTGEIDNLISITENKIELLKENRTSTINRVITKGLDPNVELKDSGIEWIGEIPKHWEMTKMKYLGETIIGLSYSPEDMVDENEGILVLRSSNIQQGKLYLEDNVYVRTKVKEKIILREGDILICSRNGSRNLIGKNVVIDSRMVGNTFGVFMSIFRTKYWGFISKVLNSPIFHNQSDLFLTSTINQLTSDTLNNFVIPFTHDENEREEVVKYLDQITQDIDTLISIEQQRIETLKEYRQSLISEVITGKVRVCEEVKQ